MPSHTHSLTYITPTTLYTPHNSFFKINKKWQRYARPRSPQGGGTINAPVDGPTPDGSGGCRDTSLNLSFCNIRGLSSNFASVEHHLSSAKPDLLFLTETQLGEATDSRPYSVPSYFLYTNFKAKGGCCVYVRNNISCSRVPDCDSSEFSTLWLRLTSNSLTRYFCAVYLWADVQNFSAGCLELDVI